METRGRTQQMRNVAQQGLPQEEVEDQLQDQQEENVEETEQQVVPQESPILVQQNAAQVPQEIRAQRNVPQFRVVILFALAFALVGNNQPINYSTQAGQTLY